MSSRPASGARRLAVGELIDLEPLTAGGREPTARELRAALPRGWVLEPDGRHAHRDARLLLREGWILIVGMVCFGAVGLAFLWGAVPRGWSGLARLVVLAGLVLLVGGVVGPLVTRGLMGGRSDRRRRAAYSSDTARSKVSE